MEALEWDSLNVAEFCDEFLVTRIGFVKGDKVNSDLTWVNEGEGNFCRIDPSQVKTNEKVSTGANLDRPHLKQTL